MLSIVRYVQKLALMFWLGEMLFFVVIYAPRVFKVLPRAQAAQLQDAIFPPYYLAGILCSALLVVTQLVFFRFEDVKSFLGWRFVLPLLLIIGAGLIFFYSYTVITPRLTELQSAVLSVPKDAMTPEAIEFRHLHHLSVQVNGAALLMLLALLGILF
jgi:hypothetical protein